MANFPCRNKNARAAATARESMALHALSKSIGAQNIVKRARLCVQEGGKPFEHLL